MKLMVAIMCDEDKEHSKRGKRKKTEVGDQYVILHSNVKVLRCSRICKPPVTYVAENFAVPLSFGGDAVMPKILGRS